MDRIAPPVDDPGDCKRKDAGGELGASALTSGSPPSVLVVAAATAAAVLSLEVRGDKV